MRMILCEDIRLGALCTENLGAKLSGKWQDARTAKFRTLIEHAAEEQAEYIALFGNIFGQERVAEAVLDGLFDAVRTAAEIQVLLFLNQEEYMRINYRSDKPENLHMICTDISDIFDDDHLAVRILKGNVKLQLDDNDALMIRRAAEGGFTLTVLDEDHIVPSFEPIGFEDSLNKTFGYSVLEWEPEESDSWVESSGLIEVKRNGDGSVTASSHVSDWYLESYETNVVVELKNLETDEVTNTVNSTGIRYRLNESSRDVAEGTATQAVFGRMAVPVSTTKSYTGHTLGACGAIEAVATVEMMRGGWFAPNLNLESPDPQCGENDFIMGEGRPLDVEFAMSNNFAFGGVNTSLVFRRI